MIAFGSILLDPALPVTFIAVTVVLVAVCGWFSFRRCAITQQERMLLWGLRMGAICILALLLLQPQKRSVSHDHEAPALAVALDLSASMTEHINPDAPARSERALELLKDKRIARLAEKYRLFMYEIGSDVSERNEMVNNIRFNAPRSHISSGINKIADRLHADNVAGILLLTDGIDHSAAQLTPQALSMPVFIPELEDPFEPEVTATDYWIGELSYPKMMVVNWKGSVDVIIRRTGGRKAAFPVHFRQGNRLLRTSLVEFEETERFKSISFAIEPLEIGQTLYELQIEPPEDADSGNNRREFLVEVTDPQNRVLYLEGLPRWEFKFLKRALLLEENYQVSAFVQGGGGSFINFSETDGMSGNLTPKLASDSLKDYKVIVLGDLPASALQEDECKSIRDFVDKGGGLLLIGAARAYGNGGLHDAPYLQELLPATPQAGSSMKEGRFTVDFTASGRAHPALTAVPRETQLPPVLTFYSPVTVRESSSALIAAADGSPILAVRRFGQGRVAMILSDTLWRWQLGAASGAQEKSLYNVFITQLIYWLAPSEKNIEESNLLQLLVAENEVELRQEVTIGAVQQGLAESENPVLQCRITTPEGRVFSYPMIKGTLGADVGINGQIQGFKCRFTPQIPGRYHVSVNNIESAEETKLLLLAKEPEHEKTGAPLNREFLQQVANATGGRFVNWEMRHELLEAIPHEKTEIELVQEYPLWNSWWWILTLMLLFTGEWWLRRRLDLV